jgi:precorrin-8X/cobalt-precorrin-8 methylmutase
MEIKIEQVLPNDIEKRSFEIITEELGSKYIPKELEQVIKRVIHTTADFEYADTMMFSENVIPRALKAIKEGACIVTDTQMVKSGINKKTLERFGGEVYCFMSDDDIAELAKKNGTTRAVASMDKAATLDKKLIFAIGNAPTALIRIHQLVEEGKLNPELVIGVPVGFVNVVSSKELIMESSVPYIVAAGRKGGSNVAAAICNALLYTLDNNR